MQSSIISFCCWYSKLIHTNKKGSHNNIHLKLDLSEQNLERKKKSIFHLQSPIQLQNRIQCRILRRENMKTNQIWRKQPQS